MIRYAHSASYQLQLVSSPGKRSGNMREGGLVKLARLNVGIPGDSSMVAGSPVLLHGRRKQGGKPPHRF